MQGVVYSASGGSQPAIVKRGGEVLSSNYWSSTTNANNTNNAWHVNFNNGNVNNNNKSNNYYVRAVRSGKCELLSFEALYRAYLDCRKRKRGTINALSFEVDLLENLFDLANDLQKGTYQPSRSVCFVTTKPKNREIFAADFRDRVVHHLLVRELEKIWEKKFIYDSYASRLGKGSHAAVDRLQHFMLKVTRNRKRPAWFLQLDIRSYFVAVDKDILFQLFMRDIKISDHPQVEVLLYLLERIIYHDCSRNFSFKGDPGMLSRVPAHKSLLKVPAGKGLPIGNLTSQFFANVYLNELDQFVKHQLKCRFYLRYVDDFILLADNPEQLSLWRSRIAGFLDEHLALTLKSGDRVKRVSEGADFLGYIVRPNYRLCRRRVVNNLKQRLDEFQQRLSRRFTLGTTFQVEHFRCDPEVVGKLRQVLASYLGHFKHADTYKLIQSLFSRYPWLSQLFRLIDGRLTELFRHPGVFRSLKQQVAFFRHRLAPGTSLLVQVGTYLEIYNEDVKVLAEVLGLRVRNDFRGFSLAAGFPRCKAQNYIRRILTAGFPAALVLEGERPGRYLKERYLNDIYIIGGCS